MNPTDPSYRAVESVLVASAPERTDELRRLLSTFPHQIELAPDRAGFELEAGPFGLLVFTARTMRQIWLLSFAAWKAFVAYGAVVQVLQARGEPLDLRRTKLFPGQEEADKDFDRLADAAESLRSLSDLDAFAWPQGIPRLEALANGPLPVQDRAAFELTCIASAFVFLHELRHIMFNQGGHAPGSPNDEEIACDEFAYDFLTSQIGAYAASSGYDAGRVREKRSSGIALASAILLVVTPPTARRASKSHPALGPRLRDLINRLSLHSNGLCFWPFTASTLISVLRRAGQLEGKAVPFVSAEELCRSLLDTI